MPRPDISWVAFAFGAAEAEVLPGPVLARVLMELGASPSAAKALLNRLVGWRQLELTRRGRLGLYRLSGRTKDAFDALVSPGPAPLWDGRFHVLLYSIAEEGKRSRDVLRNAAHAHGYRTVRPGVLAGPADLSGEVLARAAADDVITGWLEVDGEQAHRLVSRLWQIDEVRRARARLADELEALIADPPELDGRSALVFLHERLSPAYELLLAHRDLPAALLPDDLGFGRLARLVARVGERYGAQAAAWVAGVADDLGYGDLVVADRRWAPRSDGDAPGQQAVQQQQGDPGGQAPDGH